MGQIIIYWLIDRLVDFCYHMLVSAVNCPCCRLVHQARSSAFLPASSLRYSPTGSCMTHRACAGRLAGCLASLCFCSSLGCYPWSTTTPISSALPSALSSALLWCRTWHSEHTTNDVSWSRSLSVWSCRLVCLLYCSLYSTSRRSTRAPAAITSTASRSLIRSAARPRSASQGTSVDFNAALC